VAIVTVLAGFPVNLSRIITFFKKNLGASRAY
jgi:hypothetical protein